MIKLSVIIVAFKDMKSVNRCLDSLPRDPEIETIVIDNTNHNRGFGKGCNHAAQTAKGEYLFFLNPDCRLHQGDLKSLIDTCADSSIGIAAPKIVDEKGKFTKSYSQQPTKTSSWIVYSILNQWFRHVSTVKRHWMDIKEPKKILDVGIVSGAALCISKKLFQQIGGFDEKFFLFWEEVDLCKRVLAKSLRVVVAPDLVFEHIGHTSTLEVKSEASEWFKESRVYFFSKHFGRPYALLLETFLSLTEEWRFVLLLLALMLVNILYYFSGWWAIWGNSAQLWYLVSAALALVYAAAVKTMWNKLNIATRIGSCIVYPMMLIGNQLALPLMAVMSGLWIFSDLNFSWKKWRLPLLSFWMAAGLTIGLYTLAIRPLIPPKYTLYQWQKYVAVAKAPTGLAALKLSCDGCTQADITILNQQVDVVSSPKQANAAVFLPPHSQLQLINSIMMDVDGIRIVWPKKIN